MMSNSQLKIALVTPVISGHKLRGTGIYADNLFESLKRNESINIRCININDKVDNYDLVHYPYFDPFDLTLPIFRHKRSIVTVHDLIPLQFPEKFRIGIKGWIKWAIQKYSLSKSVFIVTDSFASKENIVRFTTISKEKIKIVYLGVGRQFIKKNRISLSKIAEKLNLPENFILYVGDVNYNKNIPNLIKAFYKINSINKKLHLILVGKGFFMPTFELSQIKKYISLYGINSYIHMMHSLEISDLVALYNIAKAYIQISLAEGFGLPILEAMSCGCPVVTSNVSSVSEIGGDAVMTVNPRNTDDIRDVIIRLLKNSSLRERYINAGLKRASQFSWDKTAYETVKVYQQTMNLN